MNVREMRDALSSIIARDDSAGDWIVFASRQPDPDDDDRVWHEILGCDGFENGEPTLLVLGDEVQG